MASGDTTFPMKVALGLVPGWTTFRKFGTNPDVGTSTEDIWGVGGVRVLPTTAATAVVASSSLEDDGDPAGTGAYTVEIRGLDANYVEQSEVITLNGTANVNSVNSYLRVDRAFVRECGSSDTNVGNITITVGGNAQASILAGQGQTAIAMYTVPAGKYWMIDYYSVGVGRMAGSSDCNIEGQIRLYNDTVAATNEHEGWRSISNLHMYNGQEHANPSSVTIIPPKTDVRAQITSSVATQAHAIIGGYLIDATEFNR